MGVNAFHLLIRQEWVLRVEPSPISDRVCEEGYH
jgi:hypothetical protein